MYAIFVLLAAALLAVAPLTVDPASVATSGDSLEIATKWCDPTFGGPCTFVAVVRDARLLFFRWDLRNPPGWDYPAQSSGPMGTWTTESEVTVPYHGDAPRRVCVQAWDGTSTKVENGTKVPDGPIACTGLLLDGLLVIRPSQWSWRSEGRWVTAFLDVPADVDPRGIDPGTVELNGIPALSWPVEGAAHGARSGGPDWMFKVERQPLTETLGPGTHVVYLRGSWEDGIFVAAGEISIL